MAKIRAEIVKIIKEIKDNNLGCVTIWDKTFGITSDELSELIKALETNTSVTHLVLNHQKLSSTDACNITQLFKLNTNIFTLRLVRNNIDDKGVYHLAQLLRANKNIYFLDLGDNNIGDLGIKYLSDALMINRTLDNIKLCKNNVSDNGIKILTKSLLVNKSLLWIDLTYNEIKQDGFEALKQYYKTNKLLTIILVDNSFVNHELGILRQKSHQSKCKIGDFIYKMFADKKLSNPEASSGLDESDNEFYPNYDIDKFDHSNRHMFKLYQKSNQKFLKKYLTDSEYVDGNFIIDQRVNPYIWHNNLEIMGVCKNLVKHIYNDDQEYSRHDDNSVGIWDLPVELIGYIFSFLGENS